MAELFPSKLVERVDFSEDLALFKFRPEGVFTFKPGQYATIAVRGEGDKLIQRPYSIASSPHEPFLEFYVELVPNGALTPRLWALRVGDSVLIRSRIVGKFTLDEQSGAAGDGDGTARPHGHMMVGTVTGAAPYISMARTQRFELANGMLAAPRPMVILHGASRSWELGPYRDELAEIARDGWLTYVPTVSRPWEDTGWAGERGRVEELIRKHADAAGLVGPNATAYLCGHPGMIENAKGILARAGFPRDHIREEKYF